MHGNIFRSVCQEFCPQGGVPVQVPSWTRCTPSGPGTPPRPGTPSGPGTPLPQDQVPPSPRTRYTPWDQVHPPGTRYTPSRTRYTPWEQCMLGDTGNKRAVRILLKCILVAYTFVLLEWAPDSLLAKIRKQV